MTAKMKLPEFSTPPLIEVALSIQFARTSFSHEHIGSLWDVFRSEFKNIEYQIPIPPVFETFGISNTRPQQIEIKHVSPALVPRVWLLNDYNSELIQVQPDRFVHNWKKSSEMANYPRYEYIREKFLRELNLIEDFFITNSIGTIKANQCEVTYVNIISTEHYSIDSVIALWNSKAHRDLGEFEDGSLGARFIIKDASNEPIGRILIDCRPTIDQKGSPAIQLSITGRAPPAAETVEASMILLDDLRERVVKMFAGITTEKMHQVWDRSQ